MTSPDFPLMGDVLSTFQQKFGCRVYQRGERRWIGRALNGATSYYTPITHRDDVEVPPRLLRNICFKLGIPREQYEEVFGLQRD